MIRPEKYNTHRTATREHAHQLGYIMLLSTNGWAYYMQVHYHQEFPMDENHRCAFCKGDPLNTYGTLGRETNINYYYQHTPTAKNCPVCRGATN